MRDHAPRSKSRFVWLAFTPLALVAGPISIAAQAPAAGPPMRGFTGPAAARERVTEARLAALLNRDSTGRAFRAFTAVPHPAGTAANKKVAEQIADRLRKYGWEDVRIRRYDVLLPFPEKVSVEMTAPVRYSATLKEDAYPVDPDSRADAGPTYLGMSGSGDVSGELIYANSGNPADYDWLESQGVSVKGKIAIVRYSNPYSYRGFKALTAEQRGVKALLIYSDPQEDGYRRGLTFPNGPFGPESHIQRGAISYDFIAAGDPLTPGWASVDGARRIAESESKSIPHIIMVPLSARDATPLLRHLKGPVAPPAWQGALPFTYRVGAGPSTLHVQVKMDGKTRPIYDVEARIRGAQEPEKTVVLGNHHDAWVYGGVDPSSGTATQMELARVLGAMVKEGHRPRRTLVLTSWDAEEWHLTGSTEWGEEFGAELSRSAVAYLNVDGSTSGRDFSASAVGSMNPLIVETVRDVVDPETNRSVLDSWARHEWKEPRSATVDSLSLPTNRLGSGSDYTVFLNFLGIPIVDMAFGGPYGVYHSIYDDYYWMTHFGDPGFRYMTTMAEVWGRMALRLANADVLPYDFSTYANRVGGFLGALDSLPGVNANLDLREAKAAVAGWAAASGELELAMQRALATPAAGDDVQRVALMNEAMRTVEQQWLLAEGIPGRPWFKHALYAPKYTYAALELPGVREAIDANDWPRARKELTKLVQRITAVTAAVRRAVAATNP
jgi:N-acetylated-alpha-linked acidic dipeptidase